MTKVKFQALCGSDGKEWLLWDTSLSWNTLYPDFTLCFQYTVLNWILVVYVFIISIFCIPILRLKPSKYYQQKGKFNIFKSIIIVFLFYIYMLNLSKAISERMSNEVAPAAVFIQPILSGLSMMLLLYLNQQYYFKGIHTSGIQFIYWTLHFTIAIILLYSRCRTTNLATGTDTFRTVTTFLEFFLVLIMFVSNCFTDKSVFISRDRRSSSNIESKNINMSTDEKLPNPCPEAEASFLSRITFLWITGLIIRGYRKCLTFSDLYDLQIKDSCDNIVPRMQQEWARQIRQETDRSPQQMSFQKSFKYQALPTFETEFSEDYEKKEEIQKPKSVSLFKVLFNVFGAEYLYVGFLKVIYDVVTFIQPQLLGVLIVFVEDTKAYVWQGLFIGLMLTIVSVLKTLVFQNYCFGCQETGMHVRTAIIGMVYRKALRLSPAQRKDATIGEIVNLMSVDAQKLQEAPPYLHWIWGCPVLIGASLYFLWQELGISVLVGLVLLICLIPLNIVIGSMMKRIQDKQMKTKDSRIKLMNEILNGIKILKLYAWERSFEEKIYGIRNIECKLLRFSNYISSLTAVTMYCSPYLVTLFTFGTYILIDPTNVLPPNKVFVSLSLFAILNLPMMVMPNTVVYTIQAYVSVRRLQKFLNETELDSNNVSSVEHYEAGEPLVKVENGEFSWGENERSTLTNINFEVENKSLIAVVGPVGSGKTSLVSALLGEMNKKCGIVKYSGSVGYVPQQPWCMNASIQDNIIFGQPLNQSRYNKIIQACALKDDFKIFPAGDQTEVGEKGINLSGGQKQRISLARAVYQDTSIYILDDPLSAVDSHVGKHIFNEVIGSSGLLANKTRILVTHSLTCLPKVEKIFVMTDGEISESGTYKELLNKDGAFAEYIRTYLEQEEEEDVEDSEDEARQLKAELRKSFTRSRSTGSNSQTSLDVSQDLSIHSSKVHSRQHSRVKSRSSRKSWIEEAEKEAMKENRKNIIEKEFAETGSVKMGVFLSYLKSASPIMVVIAVLSYFLYLASSLIANLFLSSWSETNSVNGSVTQTAKNNYFSIYGGLGVAQVVTMFIENIAMAYGAYLASKLMHNLVLNKILRAPSLFFDTTPLGRILNRIGKDIDSVDVNIPITLRMWLSTFSGVVGTVIVICIAYPYFLIALVPLSILYYGIQRLYIRTSRQLKRIDSLRRSPIYSHFQESLVGITSIRAYKVSDRFIEKCDLLTDQNQTVWYENLISNRWVQFNLETIGNFIILITCLLAILMRTYIGGGLAGLSVSYAIQVTLNLNLMIRASCELENQTVALERIKEYIDIQSENKWVIDDSRPPSNWPDNGTIEFRNYSIRYRPGLELVLKNINLKIEAGEKIGIVGRTGAGKSSLTLGLFRLIEPAEGTIYIDGLNITQMGLHDLRKHLTIIPQDPVLFSGTLRMNLDPFDIYTDAELWTALELAHLRDFISKCEGGLNYYVTEGGDNLSVGQRQLVCLARALLKKTRVLVLDEATAAVDLETDDLIQNSIRRQFKQCTVLTIAHRLNTIMDYDKVLVLDKGKVKEIGSPENLLADERSAFYSLAVDAGLV